MLLWTKWHNNYCTKWCMVLWVVYVINERIITDSSPWLMQFSTAWSTWNIHQKLQRVQHSLACIIIWSSINTSITKLLDDLHWLLVHSSICFIVNIITFKVVTFQQTQNRRSMPKTFYSGLTPRILVPVPMSTMLPNYGLPFFRVYVVHGMSLPFSRPLRHHPSRCLNVAILFSFHAFGSFILDKVGLNLSFIRIVL